MKRLIATIAVLMIPATTVIARVETTKLGGSGGFVDGLSVDGLRCEYLVNPIGIDVETPRLSWGLIDAKSVCGQQQMGYQILIATSLAKLNDRDADVWNSGKVVSNQSHLVACEGAGLRSGGDYYWKVRVYDRDGRVSAWSKTARFSMGLLDRSDWKGEWIKHPAAAPEKHIWFRKNVSTDSKATSAFVYIASVGYHILYVNGRQADERILAPALTRFDRRVLYVTYDVAHLLKKGDNTIAVWYAPGWSNHRNITSSMNQTFLLQLSGTTVKNELIELHSDESWKCAESCGTNSGNFQMGDMGGEGMDARRYNPQWNTTGFDIHWLNAVKTSPLKDGKEPVLSAQMTDPTRVIEIIPAQSVSGIESGVWKADMGKNFTGFLEMKFNGLNVGDTVHFSISDRKDSLDLFHQNHYYVARGENGETFRNRFNFFAGRYIYIRGLKHTPKPADIIGYSITSAAERTATFECSDTLLNRIFEADLRTYEACTTEGFTADCPNRERLGYGSESAYQTTFGLGLPCFASGAFYMKNVRDWSDMQFPSGTMFNIAPQAIYTWGGPIYCGANMNVAYEHYLAYGDRKILEEAYPVGKNWIEYLASRKTVDGLLTQYTSDPGCYLGDWLAPGYRMEIGDSEKARFFNICVHAFTLDCFIRIAQELGYNDEVLSYLEKLQFIRTKAHEKYFNPAINSYLNGDQVRTAFALYAGIVPDSLREAVSEHLKEDLAGEHPYFDIGSPSRYPYFKILLADPRFHEIVAGILAKTSYPGYGYFIATGETTLPETWESNLPGHREGNTSAHIHTSYAGISAWFIKGLAGIEPDKNDPGYRTVTICPFVPQNLTYAKASITSPYGKIESGWRKENDKVIYEITVPTGSKANVYLPENGEPLQVEAGKYTLVKHNGELKIKN